MLGANAPVCPVRGRRGGPSVVEVRAVEESDVITVQDEDGREHRFNLVDVVEVNRQRYAVLLPEDEEDAAAVIFRMESEDHLVPIEDDDELKRVMDALEATETYGEIVLEDGRDDRDELGALDDLGEDYEGNGDRGEDEDDEEDE
jgi:uncharacterized protein YrzB (UPF0473 family)